MKLRLSVCLASLLLPLPALAAEPQPFALEYLASYGSLNGAASRSLGQDAGQWLLQSKVEIKLLGATITSIEEQSRFAWQDGLPKSISYRFEQKGAGKRQRSLTFNADGTRAAFKVNSEQGELQVPLPGFDTLNSQLAIRHQLEEGSEEISLNVADKGEVNVQHYKVVGTESVKTPAGDFDAIHLHRVREGDSKRQTDLWLAPALDHAMVKLVQLEPDGDTIRLEVKKGKVGNRVLGNP